MSTANEQNKQDKDNITSLVAVYNFRASNIREKIARNPKKELYPVLNSEIQVCSCDSNKIANPRNLKTPAAESRENFMSLGISNDHKTSLAGGSKGQWRMH